MNAVNCVWLWSVVSLEPHNQSLLVMYVLFFDSILALSNCDPASDPGRYLTNEDALFCQHL